MKEVIVHPLPILTTEIHEVPMPEPGDDEIIIKVSVAGSNVKDWSHITAQKLSVNSGDDAAGTIFAFGKNVATAGEFKIGDRVAGFHEMLKPGGTYAEFCVVPAHTVFVIPETISFEEAATIPLVTLTAAISLFRRQSLPTPWSPLPPSNISTPLIIYGASSALGCFAIKLASLANIHPIVAISGSSKAYISTLLSEDKGDRVIDYRQGVDAWKAEVARVLRGKPAAKHALDAISANGTWIPVAELLADLSSEPSDPRPQLSVVSGANAYIDDVPSIVDVKYTYVGSAHYGAYKPTMPKQPPAEEVQADVEFAWVMSRYVTRALARGTFSGHPWEVIPGGLAGVQDGLRRLKDGRANGKKFVYRIEETVSL